MKILVTGFEPFPGYPDNPSAWVAGQLRDRRMPGAALETRVLPVDYARAGMEMQELIGALQPEAVLSLGLAGKSSRIRLERVALNLNDSSRPDNEGRIQEGLPIHPQAPAAYFTSLPLAEMRQALADAGIPVRISNHAGAYLCNHVFFCAMHAIRTMGLNTRAGFVHLPLHAESHPAGEGLSRQELLGAIEILVGVLVETQEARTAS